MSRYEEPYESGDEVLTVALEVVQTFDFSGHSSNPHPFLSLYSSFMSILLTSLMGQVSYTHRAFAHLLSVLSPGFRSITILSRKHS